MNDDAAGTDPIEPATLETEAQLEVLRVLKPLTAHQRLLVMRAVDHLIQADACVPGVFEAAARGLASREPRGSAPPCKI
jgi:hypothetical protein